MREITREVLTPFINESNRIEGIHREPTFDEYEAHAVLLGLPTLRVGDICSFVKWVANAPLRERAGMDVRVGTHYPQPGGPGIREQLSDILDLVQAGRLSPFILHQQYESLHPFMDGNGRSGRLIWAWDMRHRGYDPFYLSFLHRWYYQSLDAYRP